MIGFLIATGLGYFGKWRWLGFAYLFDLLVTGTSGLIGGGDFDLLFLLIAPLLEVPAGYGFGMVLGRWRQGAWPRDRVIAELAPLRQEADADGKPVLTWEIEAAMLTPQVALVFGLAVVLLFLFVSVLFGFLTRDLASGVTMAAVGSGGLVVLFLVVVFGLFFNRLRRRYVLTETGYASSITDPRMLTGIAAAGAAGVGSGDTVTTGVASGGAAGLREQRNWSTIVAAVGEPARHRIRIQLGGFGWLGRDTIVCQPEDYPAIVAWIAELVPGTAIPDGSSL